jgi:inner membrane protein
MTRSSHYLIGLGSAAAIAGWNPTPVSVLLAFGAIVGANLPDDLEIWPSHPPMLGPASPLIPHRTITHWPWSWAAVLLLSAFIHNSIATFIGGIALGGLIHLLCDTFSPHGIPWVTPTSALKPSFTIYTTRKSSEMLIVLPVIILGVFGIAHGWASLPGVFEQMIGMVVRSFLHSLPQFPHG